MDDDDYQQAYDDAPDWWCLWCGMWVIGNTCPQCGMSNNGDENVVLVVFDDSPLDGDQLLGYLAGTERPQP